MGGKSKYTYSGYDGYTPGGAAWLFTKRWLAAGTAMSVAELCTIPVDTAKVRLQLQGQTKLAPGQVPYTSMTNCLLRMAREEGPTSLFKGLKPGILRQMVYGGLRLGMYDNVRDFYALKIDGTSDGSSFAVKVASGFTTGALAMCAGQPADVLKIRFQSGEVAYKGLTDAFVQTVKRDGVAGLWRGLGPNITRNAVINTAELATYDQIKESLMAPAVGMKDGLPLQMMASAGAGLCAVVVGSPFDVVKTRIMNATPNPDGSPMFKSMPDAFAKIFKNEGPMAFYKGFVPNFVRLGSWVTVMFVSYEQIKANFWPYLN